MYSSHGIAATATKYRYTLGRIVFRNVGPLSLEANAFTSITRLEIDLASQRRSMIRSKYASCGLVLKIRHHMPLHILSFWLVDNIDIGERTCGRGRG
ncbi:hypothetical protein MRX96_028719 [Rhipicephalus microplus]